MIPISKYFEQQQQFVIFLFHFSTPSDKELSVKEWKTNINFFFKRHESQSFSTIYLTGDVRLLHVTYVYICINEDFLFMFEAVIE